MLFREDALSGQHIVISGGCGAIGVGVVKKLTDHGAVMTVNDIISRKDALERLDDASVKPDQFAYVRGDLSKPADVTDFIAAARAKFGPIHTALCHTGVVLPANILEFTEDDFDKTMSVNVKTALLLGQAAARAMIEDGVKGHLIFTSSWVAEVPWPDIGLYTTSKSAMNQLMRAFARELVDKGIRANSMAPGIVSVGMAKWQWDTDPAYRARATKAIALGYMQPLESVANGFLFLCSAAADYMTGSVLTIDGGCGLYPID